MYQFFIGTVISFLFWKFFAGKHEGDRLERSIRFLIKNYWVHIHHWLWALVVWGILYFFHIKNLFVYGILCGSILQGLTYKDWYYIIYRKEKAEGIYS